MSMRAPFLQYVDASPASSSFLATGIALLTIALYTASLNQHHKQERMSSSSKQERPRTPFEMIAIDGDDEHPIDFLVASRLPQTGLKEDIRDTVDAIRLALGEHRSLWMELEVKLSERHGARSEEYFNIGYEYGLAAGRAQALETLRANAAPDTQQLAERLGALVKNEQLPASAIVAVLLEVAWALTHEIAKPTTHTES